MSPNARTRTLISKETDVGECRRSILRGGLFSILERDSLIRREKPESPPLDCRENRAPNNRQYPPPTSLKPLNHDAKFMLHLQLEFGQLESNSSRPSCGSIIALGWHMMTFYGMLYQHFQLVSSLPNSSCTYNQNLVKGDHSRRQARRIIWSWISKLARVSGYAK